MSDASPQPVAAGPALQRTLSWWRDWMDERSIASDTPRRAQVERSALVLRGLTCPRTGAAVAAPTTSLPETAGGDASWDYRYAWLRDSPGWR